MNAMLAVMRAQGVSAATFDSVLRHLASADPEISWSIPPVPLDSGIARARSIVATQFLRSGFDVLVMCDWDIEFDSFGLEYITRKARDLQAHVGAIVSLKQIGGGYGSRFVDDVPHELYTDEMVELGPHAYLGGAFTATHRTVFMRLIEAGVVEFAQAQDFWQFFQPTSVQDYHGTGVDDLTEDWAFSERVRKVAKVYAAMRPAVHHHGDCAFTALDGNQGVPT